MPFIAGHDLIKLEYAFDCNAHSHHTITRRYLKHFDATQFSNLLSPLLCPLSADSPSSSAIDKSLEHRNESIISVLDTLAPLLTFNVREPRIPWLTDELRQRIKTKNLLYKKAIRWGNLFNPLTFRHFCDKLFIDFRQAKDQYCFDWLSRTSDSARTWSELRGLRLVKSEMAFYTNYFSINDLNSFFANISSSAPRYSLESFLLNNPPLHPNSVVFEFSSVSADDILSVFNKSLSPTHSAGPDGVSALTLISALPIIIPFLAKLFNISFDPAHFPSIWKRAHIRPLLKFNPPT